MDTAAAKKRWATAVAVLDDAAFDAHVHNCRGDNWPGLTFPECEYGPCVRRRVAIAVLRSPAALEALDTERASHEGHEVRREEPESVGLQQLGVYRLVCTTCEGQVEALEEARAERDELKTGYQRSVEEGVSVLAQYEEASAHLEAAEDTIEQQHERLEEAQGKLRAVEQLMYEIPDYVLRCRLDRILRGTKEGE